MRSRLILSLLLVTVGCVKKDSTRVCTPVASWSSPAVTCAAPAAAPIVPVAAPAPEPAPAPPPSPKAAVGDEKIDLAETVQFESGSAVLVEHSKPLLDDVVKVMADHPELTKVEIQGHTDSTSTRSFNQKLSEERAKAVKTYLVDHGIDAKRLTTKGFGQDKPIADNKTDEGRFKNRRVDLKILARKK